MCSFDFLVKANENITGRGGIKSCVPVLRFSRFTENYYSGKLCAANGAEYWNGKLSLSSFCAYFSRTFQAIPLQANVNCRSPIRNSLLSLWYFLPALLPQKTLVSYFDEVRFMQNSSR